LSRKKIIKNYWNDTHEELLINYINASTKEERSRIYSGLHKVIIKMCEIILKRYFMHKHSNLIRDEIKTLIDDAEIHLIEYSLMLYNPEKGKGYSFIGTSIRRHYQNVFYLVNVDKNRNENLYNEEGHLLHDIPINQDDEQLTINYDQLLNAAKIRISEIYESIQSDIDDYNKRKKYNYLKNNTIRLSIIENLLIFLNEEKNFSKYWLTYYLVKKTGLDSKVIYHCLRKYDLSALIVASNNIFINYFDNLYSEQDKTIYPTIKDYLCNFKDNIPESKIKIRDSKSVKENKRTKEIIRRNEIRKEKTE